MSPAIVLQLILQVSAFVLETNPPKPHLSTMGLVCQPSASPVTMINLPPPVHGLCAGYNCADSHGPFSAVLGVSVSSLRHAHRSCTSVAQIRFTLNPNHVPAPPCFLLASFLLPSSSHLYLDAHVLHKLFFTSFRSFSNYLIPPCFLFLFPFQNHILFLFLFLFLQGFSCQEVSC